MAPTFPIITLSLTFPVILSILKDSEKDVDSDEWGLEPLLHL